MMKSPNCKRCGGQLVDRIAPMSGRPLRYCPSCHGLRKKSLRKVRPEVAQAQRKLAYAVGTGVLVRQPCEVCGNPQSEGHHGNYANALQVQWLCRLHHRRLHAALRKAGAKVGKAKA